MNRFPFPCVSSLRKMPQSLANRAFSLVETVIAVGITALIVLGLLGMLPSGLENLRQSGYRVAAARIVQSIHADYQMKDWKDVISTTKATTDYYFDDRGTRLFTATDPLKSYVARASVENSPILPGAAATNPHLRKVIIRISDKPENPDALTDPQFYRQHQTLVAKVDK